MQIAILFAVSNYYINQFINKYCYCLAQQRPFRVTFKTDDNEQTTGTVTTTNEQEMGPGGIIGFSLNYIQQAC